MTGNIQFRKKTFELIDDLKSVCANYGLGNDGNEFKIITQIFLYKFLNDKFVFEIKQLDKQVADAGEDWEDVVNAMSDDDYDLLLMQLRGSTARIRREHFVSSLFGKQNEPNFAKTFDQSLLDIAADNSGVFSVVTEGRDKIILFDKVSEFVTDRRDDFCRALINKLVGFSFEHIFEEKFDFFAVIFEYLIKDYNTNSGGKYAEYFTPHAVSKIMARCLVQHEVSSVTCYDPSAGSGTLLMNLAHQIGEEKCSIYSQDISQKSSHLLRLNLILNDLVHSIPHIVKGNTLLDPFHKEKGGELAKFDFIVSNPPFKLDFSDFRDELARTENNDRFFAGIPNIPKKKKESMAIYLLFLQHIIHSMSPTGKAAIVVPTGFITAQSGIEKKIRAKLVKSKMLAGLVSMPSNIFANTGTNVSILFLDNENKGDVVLIDATKLGEEVKEGKNKRTVLTRDEEDLIISTFNDKLVHDEFSVVVGYDEIEEKNFSLSAGQYFEVKVEFVELTKAEFDDQLKSLDSDLQSLFDESRKLEIAIKKSMEELNFG